MENNKIVKKNVLHWFRKGLRLHDNPALKDSLADANSYHCVYILDPWFAGVSQVGVNRWRFLLQCLEDLDASLRKLNSRLFVVRGQPAEVFPKLFKEWDITDLSFEEDPEPYGKIRDNAITEMAKEVGVKVVVRCSHTLYNLQKIISENSGHPPLTFKRFQSILSKMGLPEKPEDAVTMETLGSASTPIAPDQDEKYGVPSLEELVPKFAKPGIIAMELDEGFETEGLTCKAFRGGETEALHRLHRHLERKAWVASFEKPKMTAQSLFPSQTTLSPYLRFGCISPRLFYWKLHELYRKVKRRSDPPFSLHGQLLWREFFYTLSTSNPNFDKMEGNPICVQIPWDKNPEALAKWAEGKTGFPWIDAIMVQLKEVGWVHHLARHAITCFLTRGDLWISWEEGFKVFDVLLLDADWSVNAGMWLWLSCSSFFQQFLHCYCPVGFGKQADPTGDFIRHYLPVLKGFPPQYIYEPWNAPESVQKAARCVVGKHYPLPMVNHAEASKLCMDRMKQVYQNLLMRRSRVQLPKQIGYKSENEMESEGKHTRGNHPSKANVIADAESVMSGHRSHTSDSDTEGGNNKLPIMIKVSVH